MRLRYDQSMSGRARVFSCQNPMQAQLVRAQLEAGGILAVISGDAMPGTVPLDNRVDVWVAEDDAPAAREILGTADVGGLTLSDDDAGHLSVASAQAGALSEPEPQLCAACGAEWEPGFAVCWRCSRPLA